MTTTGPQRGLSADMLRIINGEEAPQEKELRLQHSLEAWWHEYAHRKNGEEEEHVADSLLYDERCHLPRTTAGPRFKSAAEDGDAAAAPATPAQQADGHAAADGDTAK